jgi:cytochrome c oxidase assembly protein subunit 11
MSAIPGCQRGKANLGVLFLAPVLMFGFGYLMVPIYNVFCDITGLNGKTGTISASEARELAVDEERLVKVEFTGSLNQYAPWRFSPREASMMVHPGQQYKTSYVATNQLDRSLVGQAVPSVSPGRAASHFSKTECFCFTRQHFEAGETRDMPLIFIVDPDLPRDVDTVTLSYTFFDVTEQAAN